ncbi:glycoside hydrolase family 13 protein [Spirosoma fluviale]|uniref:Oligo-1,6-glucosidase n=1 Tax=Spirosoma fluviale TaxID=1597977 RepID=A0A286GDI1_9BACT|nr:alpha-glucosidase [Spirosoma fluviale]SOD93199.1 oligo-1,6-glucosidase [Spirosoma fluviale]
MNYKDAVIYQIYPRSFADSNGDGIGDLPGILAKLDYLAELGVDILWLSPIFDSPNADNGYDVSDYEAIMPEFGTMADFDNLLAGVHQRGMRLILDLVVNHSSDEHRWFQESRKSKDNPYRDYYIWRKPKLTAEGPAEPNNWQSIFSGPAWAFDETTGEYYLHLFATKQPDLNWEHPPLREAIYKMMRFWLDKGVDGFRMDVIPFLSKDQTFPDYPAGRFGDSSVHANGPRIHEFLQEMNREVLSQYGQDGESCISIGEGIGVTADLANLYVGKNRHELNMIYHFDHAVPRDEYRFIDPAPEFTLLELKAIFAKWNVALGSVDPVTQATGGWQNIYFGNHDNPRCLSRFGDTERYWYESATMLATVLLTQRGTPNIYQGDEIGMTNCTFDSIDEYDDIQVRNAWQALVASGKHSPEVFLATSNRIARDHARTPMQWSDAPNAGFTTGEPWLKVNPNYTAINVDEQEARPDSVLQFYRKLLHWRKQIPALHEGSYRDLLPDHPSVWVFERKLNKVAFYTVANFSGEPVPMPSIPDVLFSNDRLVLANLSNQGTTLHPFEARVYEQTNF